MEFNKRSVILVCTLFFISISIGSPSTASAEIVMHVYSPADTYNGANVSPSYDITSIETGIESDDPDKIYFWIQFKNVIQASQFVYGTTQPFASIQIFREDPSSTKNYSSSIYIGTNSTTPLSGNNSITAQAFGNSYSGGPRASLSSCNPKVWSNLDQRATWIGFSISRSCANIPNEFWLSGYTDADLGNDSTSIVDYDFSNSANYWYVDISEADYINSGDYTTLEPQTITFFQSPNIALSKKYAYMNAFSDSGLDVEFASNTPKVCMPLNYSSKVKLISVGTCNIVASQGGDDYYESADDVSMYFKVTKIATITKSTSKPVPVPAPSPTKKAPGSIGGKTKN